jgi:hypothetical protein
VRAMTVLLAQAVGREAYLVKRRSFPDSDISRFTSIACHNRFSAECSKRPLSKAAAKTFRFPYNLS